jgi:hypothetical protein
MAMLDSWNPKIRKDETNKTQTDSALIKNRGSKTFCSIAAVRILDRNGHRVFLSIKHPERHVLHGRLRTPKHLPPATPSALSPFWRLPPSSVVGSEASKRTTVSQSAKWRVELGYPQGSLTNPAQPTGSSIWLTRRFPRRYQLQDAVLLSAPCIRRQQSPSHPILASKRSRSYLITN